MKKPFPGSAHGFTLAEMMVTVGVMMLVGLMIFSVLNSGMVLYAKNTAVNSAHQQARAGVDQMLANIHGSVSIPQLVDSALAPIAAPGIGPAAGISFQTFNAGPFPVVLDASASSTSIAVYCPGYVPPANARFNIPSHNIELDVVSSVAAGGYRLFNFASPIGTNIDISGTGIEGGSGTTYIITAFLTARISYAVVGTELRYYPVNDINNYKVVTRNIISPKPFTVPLLVNGGLQNRFVAAVNLSTVEPKFTQRGYAAVNMFISSLIPFRCRLTTLQ
jgi:type II secretory pathway pseudopilin PulG